MMSAKPGLAPATLDSILFTTAFDLASAGWDQEFGHGRVNAAAAVSKAMQTTAGDSVPPTVAITSPTGGSAAGLVPVDVSASDDVGVTRVELYANNALVASDTISPYGFSLDTSKYGGTVSLEARAYDAAGNTGTSNTVSLNISNDKLAPTVSILSPSSGSTVSGTVTVSVSAMDDQKVANVTLSIDGKQVAVSYGTSLKYSWNVPRPKGKQSSASTLTARAEDASGNAASASVSVTRK
jgi:Tfp pilus assembly protein PilW